MKRKILNIAHRGGRGLAPENTLRAFLTAVSAGADAIEFDVQRTIDGKLVVFHDKDLKRTMGLSVYLKDITFDGLRKLDAGGGEKVPLLEETLKLALKHRLLMIIELKNPEIFPGIEEEVYSLISNLDAAELVKIASFSAPSLDRFRLISSHFKPPLVRNYRFEMPERLEYYDAVSVDARYFRLFPWRMRNYRRHCEDVFVWNVNREQNMKYFIKIGVDGIITDYPDRLARIIADSK